jgi:exodeoxyribonuclease V alpha subunit
MIVDGFERERAVGASGLLAEFNRAGILVAADVHVARRLGALGGEDDEQVLLALALAVRAPRLGHVCVDLGSIRLTAAPESETEVDVAALPWPGPPGWAEAVAGSRLVGEGRPFRLEAGTLYLDRYWRLERQVAADLAARAGRPVPVVDREVLAGGLTRLFGPVADGDGTSPGDNFQRLAAATAVLRHLAVVAGGPGTGKTTTVARVLALLEEQAMTTGHRPPLVALAAPTGKAAARLQESVQAESARLETPEAVRVRLAGLAGTTIHRLLGRQPGNETRFRHHRLNRLPHDVVVVDETSMVALGLMARLVEAVRPDARLILLGDPDQLASVEAGSVLGDVVGPSARGLRMGRAATEALSAVAGCPVDAGDLPTGAAVGDGIVTLRQVHRFGQGISEVAAAIQAGDDDRVMELLESGVDGVSWCAEDPGPVRARAVEAHGAVVEAARRGDGAGALDALGSFRVLCAHRSGPAGASAWMAEVERWLSGALGGFGTSSPWYVGRPLLITANDYSLRLFNGDTGVVVAGDGDGGEVRAAFARGGGVVLVSPLRLSAVDTVYAMTVHKAQGSQFDSVGVVLPPVSSPLLTRELLYTAVTRARREVLLVGQEASLRRAVTTPIARSSGLGRLLWGGPVS